MSTPGSIVLKPGASDGSFMVAGVSNKVHSVTPGKGGSLSCDCSTKICKPTLTVAQLNGTLQEFVTWYKRSKRGPNITSMAAAGEPKSARPSWFFCRLIYYSTIQTNYLQKARATLKQWVASSTLQPHLFLFKAAASMASHLFLFKAAVSITSHLSGFHGHHY